MREELSDPQPGRSLIAQQLAYMMLIQALRLHSADAASAGRGWLSALSDMHMSIAITSVHNDPGYPWTLESLAERVGMSRSVFACASARPSAPRPWSTSPAGACFWLPTARRTPLTASPPSCSHSVTNLRAPMVRPSVASWAALQGAVHPVYRAVVHHPYRAQR